MSIKARWRRRRAIRSAFKWEYEMFCWGTVNKWYEAKEETDRLRATSWREWGMRRNEQ